MLSYALFCYVMFCAGLVFAHSFSGGARGPARKSEGKAPGAPHLSLPSPLGHPGGAGSAQQGASAPPQAGRCTAAQNACTQGMSHPLLAPVVCI